ncbi:MAG: hypothetical protein LBH44_05860 [Treponema sp.]|jgi:hypothetical protein|nr:hypothetical protein [Treponema sp.]
MKNTKKLLATIALVAIIQFTMTVCNGYDNNNDNGGDGDSNKGKDEFGTWHWLAEDCRGECFAEFGQVRALMSGAAAFNGVGGYGLHTDHVIHVEDAFDQSALGFWLARGGDYHNNPENFKLTAEQRREVEYKVDLIIDGKTQTKAPCFDESDITTAVYNAYNQIYECQEDI